VNIPVFKKKKEKKRKGKEKDREISGISQDISGAEVI